MTETKTEQVQQLKREPRQVWIVVCGGVLGVAITAIATGGGFSPSELFVRRAVALSLFATSIAVWARAKGETDPGRTAPDPRLLFLSGLIAGGVFARARTFDPHLFPLILAGLVPGVISGIALSPWIDRRRFMPVLSLFTFYLALQLI